MEGHVKALYAYKKSTHPLITWQVVKKPDIPMQNCLGLGCLKNRLSFEMDGEDNMRKNEVWKQKKGPNRRLK